jgi:hypothetical protein
VSHPTRVRITYVGGCPGAVDRHPHVAGDADRNARRT